MTHSFPTGSSSDLLLLTLGVAGRDAEPLAGAAGPIPVPASPWRDLGEAASSVWVTPHLLAAICLAFLINLTAFPLSGGLLPYVAKRSEEHTSELQSLMRISYAVFFLKKHTT